MDIKFCFKFVFHFYLQTLAVVGSIYIKSREESSWLSARQHCTEFGGHIATLTDLTELRRSVQTGQTTFLTGEELWVGASLQKGLWKWRGGDDSGDFKAGGRFYARRGCLEHDVGQAGSVVEKLLPEKCLNLCHWLGVVGLQEDRCLCEHELNVSSSRPGVCHIRCDDGQADMCGGYTAVSLYTPGERRISWADGEPKIENDCVVLRKGDRKSAVEFVSANCEMQTRFLCSFNDNDKCGVYHTCMRWSTLQASWKTAENECTLLNGTLAELSSSGSDDARRSLARLPPGTFWIALRRESSWQWINGQKVYPSQFHFGTSNLPDRTCAVVTNIGGNIALAARRCDTRKHYLCQYDFMRKRESTDVSEDQDDPSSPSATSVTTTGAAIAVDGGITVYDANEYELSTSSSNGGIVFTCMYMILGFVSGMVCVLILGLIVYFICRCRQPKGDKHTRLSDQSSSRHDVHSVNYSSKDDSIHISPPHSDITYDTVYDLETESPFRRTNRLIRMGSANSWRHAQSRRTPPSEPAASGFTWRGVIGGDVEIINTELRHPGRDQSDFHDFGDRSYNGAASCGSARATIEHHNTQPFENQSDFDQIEVLYDLPERSNSFDFEKNKRKVGRNPKIPTDPRFLEIRTSRCSDSNEDNIYATIKKTFEKIRDELAEQSEKEACESYPKQ